MTPCDDLFFPKSPEGQKHCVGENRRDEKEIGASGGSRTPDQLITNQLLCH